MNSDSQTLVLTTLGYPDHGHFDAPWQAHAFALTVQLHKRGLFSWPTWVKIFSEHIDANPAEPGESVSDAYFRQWLSALEVLLMQLGVTSTVAVGARAAEWRQAYVNTPHGLAVDLSHASHAPTTPHVPLPKGTPVAVSRPLV